MRSQKRRGRVLSLSVQAIGCGRHGGSIEGKGGPAEPGLKKNATSQGHLVQMTPRLSFVGVHLCAPGRDQHATFGPVVAQRTQVGEAHTHPPPGADFALVHPRESPLGRRLQALVFAPLCGIDRRTAFAPHEPPLAPLRGRGYPTAPLRQCLGQRERVGAAAAWLPVLFPAHTGPSIAVDGPMIA